MVFSLPEGHSCHVKPLVLQYLLGPSRLFLVLNSINAFLQELSGTEISGETDHPTEQAGTGHKPGFQLLSWLKHDQEYTRFTKWRLRDSGEESCKLSLSSPSHRESWGC